MYARLKSWIQIGLEIQLGPQLVGAEQDAIVALTGLLRGEGCGPGA